ncbi:Asp23/Gls24 family envelope stress response protein [Actinomycetospora lemnae]|uniref:Asp23/Gls24 family envelope stress response protein n=1 Tax=Actinomycetospora lemnae TaxID=3019891 RepID=A0ABT5SMH8_9PSEU|nr:Asp23/Gls24 family envelope stress response protein [Actinomycetospora sp. DW7H6]MDD7964047.1 Asp23/Gls24 family envelope stress response protein [Actinomycetospora sp. DW7H6]
MTQERTPSATAPLEGRLACGRDAAALVAQVADGAADRRDAHQRDCPYCQAALAEFDRLWAPVRAVADHRPQAPDGLLDEALRRIRGVAADPEFGRIEEPRGRTRVSARVVVALARHLASRVPGVRVALSHLVAAGGGPETSLDGGPEVTAGVAGSSTVVAITLAAEYGADLVALGTRIRAVVADGIRNSTGLEPVAVLVHVDDVLL